MTQRGLYRWLRLEFGLVGAPAFFQYIMDSALAGVQEKLMWMRIWTIVVALGLTGRLVGDVLYDLCVNLQISA